MDKEKEQEKKRRLLWGNAEYDRRKSEKQKQQMHTQKIESDAIMAMKNRESHEKKIEYQEKSKNQREIFKSEQAGKSELAKNQANIRIAEENHRESLDLARANFETSRSLNTQTHQHGLENKKEDLRNQLMGLFAKGRIDKSRDKQNNKHAQSMQFQEHRNQQTMQSHQYSHESGMQKRDIESNHTMQERSHQHDSEAQTRDIASHHHIQEKTHQHEQMAQIREIDNQQTQQINQYQQEQFIQRENHEQEKHLQNETHLQARYIQEVEHNHVIEMQEEARETYAHNKHVDTLEHGNKTLIDLNADTRRGEIHRENKTHETFCTIAEKITAAKLDVWVYEKKMEIASRFSKVEDGDIDEVLRKNKDKWDSEL
jgi:hypothetical protein